MARLKRIHLLCTLGAVVVAGAGVMTYNFVSQAAPAGTQPANMQQADITVPSEEEVLGKMRKINERLDAVKAPFRLESVRMFGNDLRGGLENYQLHKGATRIVMGDWWRFADFDYKALTCNPDVDHVNTYGGQEFVGQWTTKSGELYDEYGGADKKVITYMVDPTFGNAKGSKRYPDKWPELTSTQTESAIDQAMGTWDTALERYGINIAKIPYGYSEYKDHALVACWLASDPEKCECGPYGNQRAIPPSVNLAPHIVFNGWRPDGLIGEVLGTMLNGAWAIALDYVWTDPDGTPMDINTDNYMDTVATEIYFKNEFLIQEELFQGDACWGIGATHEDMLRELTGQRPYTVPVNVEFVALHEAGHGLGLSDYTNYNDPNPSAGPSGMMSYDQALLNTTELHPQDIAGLNSVYNSWDNQPFPLPAPKLLGPVIIQQP